MELAKAYVAIEARLADVKRDLNKAVKLHKSSSSRIGRMWKKVGNKIRTSFRNVFKNIGRQAKIAAAAMTVAGVAAAALVTKRSLNSWAEYERVWKSINATIKSTGGAARITAKEAWDLAGAWEKISRFSRVEVGDAISSLLTFTSIDRSIFRETLASALDAAAKLKRDLPATIIQFGKALNDPKLGVTALREVGANFNEAQTAIIKNLVDTGRALDAQKMIIKELRTEFHKSALAAGQGFGGALAKARNAWTAFTAHIGKGLADNIQEDLAKLVNTLSSPASVKVAREIGVELGNIYKTLSKIAKEQDWKQLIKDLNSAMQIALGTIKAMAAALKTLYKVGEFLGTPLRKGIDAVAAGKQHTSQQHSEGMAEISRDFSSGYLLEPLVKEIRKTNRILTDGSQAIGFSE